MGSGVPLINEYKREFFWKRFPQTVLGGLKLKLGYDAPVYVYINQIILFIIPWLLGGLFTILVELDVFVFYSSWYNNAAVYVFGGIIFLFVLITQIVSTVVQLKNSTDIPGIPTKKNILSDEDEIDFFSCFGAETFSFIVPMKKFKLNIFLHALMSGISCGTCMWYLLPTTLNGLYGFSTAATVILFIFGWITVSIAQYPLTTGSPPEPATFKTLDVHETMPLMRSFHMQLFVLFHLLNNSGLTQFNTTDQVLHIVFVFLPLFWTLGILQPVDVFFLWILEQVHIFLFGGSTSASTLRLSVMLLLSTGVFLAAYFIPSCLGTVIVSAVFGYILSIDLGGLGSQILKLFTQRNKVAASTKQNSKERTNCSRKGFLWKWGIIEVLYHLLMAAAVGGMSAGLNLSSTNFTSTVWKAIGYSIIGLCVVEKISRDLQNVYIIFGLFRNALFPSSVQRTEIFRNRKKKLKIVGIIRRIILNWVSPFMMVAYFSLLITSTDPSTVSATSLLSTSTAVWYTFGIVRAFRWAWQDTCHSLVEVSIVHIILVTIPDNSTVTTWGIPILLLLIGVSRDRVYQFINKLYSFIVIIITACTDKKQRRTFTADTVCITLILFPLFLGVLAIASILSAPLLPLFTLPVFFFAYPRPLRFWPERVGASASTCSDTVYYRQFAPEFAKALSEAFASGSLGEPDVGNYYLVRFQDRLAWVSILERGSCFCTVSIKGLELQETSCHTAEAARLDDIFEAAFESEKGFSCLNEYPMHTLTAVDAVSVKTYSDARNVLTGIIDSPNSFKLALNSTVHALIWIVLHHVRKIKKNEKAQNKLKSKKLMELTKKDGHELQEVNHNISKTSLNEKSKITWGTPKISQKKTSLTPLSSQKVFTDEDSEFGLTTNKQGGGKPRRKSSWASIDSFTDSIFSDIVDISENKNKKRPKSGRRHMQNSPVIAVTPMKSARKKSLDDDIDQIFGDVDFGLPASDISKPKPIPYPVSSKPGSNFSNINSIYKPQTNLAGSPDFKSPLSANMSLPQKWRELPVERCQLTRFVSQFPLDWYRHVLNNLDWSDIDEPKTHVVKEVSADDTLMNAYCQLVMACYSIFDSSDSQGGANLLYKFYMGNIPWNAMVDWLSEDKELFNLVIKSFRYGFKLMLDQQLLGEVSGMDEYADYFEEFDKDWYIGLEKDPEWQESIVACKPSLFALGQNAAQGVFSSRLLTLQDVDVHIGRLNAELVRAQWANLNLELLYFTNDDEERYSIQAHPTILRNLTVQSADPPLGYPIYASEPISIPTF